MASEMNCLNCSQSYGPDDMFCENCGFDFLTGSLPLELEADVAEPTVSPDAETSGEDEEQATAGANPSDDSASGIEKSEEASESEEVSESEEPMQMEDGSETTGVVERTKIEVAIDRSFFDEVVTSGEIDFPTEPEATQTIEVAGDEIHIGRTSDSRAIHPDIDVAELTKDQAVSSRHAVIRVLSAGVCQLIDVGSTNGTFINSPSSDAIEQGDPLDLAPGVPFFVGAWTRLTVIGND